MRHGRRHLLAALVLWACLPRIALTQTTPETQATENQIKAAYLYKFGGYVEWPVQSFDKADSPLVIGVLAGDTFADVLEQTIAGRSMNGHPISVRKIRHGEPYTGVHIVFISRTETAALNDAIAGVKGQAVLTVTDSERGPSAGSMINFVLEDNKVRFDIAPTPAEQNRLKISARLLNVARKVMGRAS